MKTDTRIQSRMGNGFWFKKGLKDGVPIAMGYFAVAFTLGIAARKAGMTVLQSSVMSLTMLASAGEFGAITVIGANSGFLVMIMTTLVVNLRYMLMSAALSQKIDSKTSLIHRMLISYAVTDEIFGVSASVEGKLNPFYNYGLAAIAAPGWTLGTTIGALMGAILPLRASGAMGLALYGMFLAIIIPPAKKDKVIAVLVILSMGVSFIFSVTPGLRTLSSGMRIIILTLLISAAAAIIRPVPETEGDDTKKESEEDIKKDPEEDNKIDSEDDTKKESEEDIKIDPEEDTQKDPVKDTEKKADTISAGGKEADC